MKLNIVSDSSCDLTAGDLVSSLYDFEVVPMSMQVGSSTYMDDESIDTERLLVDVKKCKEGGSSSCPSPESF
ncbi:MAG: DegV family protein, partial [Oscillospiraceae bacterium]